MRLFNSIAITSALLNGTSVQNFLGFWQQTRTGDRTHHLPSAIAQTTKELKNAETFDTQDFIENFTPC